MTPDQIDLLLEIQNRQMLALERIAALLEKLAPTNQSAPNYQRPLEQFAHFDWSSIGAEVERKDAHGAAIVNWNGQQFVRRSPANKFGAAIWFSRCIGKNEETGENLYERLITFKPVSDREVEPLPDKVTARISNNGQQSKAQTPAQPQQRQQPTIATSTQPAPGLYPQHNGVVKAVRTLTGHTPQAILDWCKANGVERPDCLPPDKLPALAEWLALGWAATRINTPIERLRNSYRGRVGTLTASGVGLAEAVISWLDSQEAGYDSTTKTPSQR